jgi:hypothetical protein
LLSIARDNESGILTVQGHDEIIALSFLEGRVVSADALNQPLEDGLGQILADRDMVSPEEFAALAGEYQAGGGRVLDLLVERRFVTQEQQLDVLRLHYYQLCRQVLGWPDGEFKFYKGDEISYEAGVEALPVEEILVKVSLDQADEPHQIVGMPGVDTVFERTDQNLPDSDPAAALAELVGPDLASRDPGRDALSLLERVDGKRSADELVRESGLEAYAGLLALYRLQEAEFIRQYQAAPEDHKSSHLADAKAANPEAISAPVEVVDLPPEGRNRARAAEAAEEDSLFIPGGYDEEAIASPAILDSAETAAVSRPARSSKKARESKGRVTELAAGLLAGGLAAVLIFMVVSSPGRFLAPLQEQENLRLEMENDRRASVYLKIDRAAKTFFLLDGLFPGDLESLVERRLLSKADLRLRDGETLGYAASPASYRITRFTRDQQEPGDMVFTETIDGNFLLDPEFVIRDDRELQPLILLD